MKLYDASAVILAGGNGSRMGFDKTELRLGSIPLLMETALLLQDCFKEVFISSNRNIPNLDLPCIADRVQGSGPLAGIAASLRHASFNTLFVIACDIPELDIELLGALIKSDPSADCVVPRINDEFLEPLFAVYRKTALPLMEERLASGRCSVHALFSRLNTCFISCPEPIVNLNTQSDLERYCLELPLSEPLLHA